MAPNNKIEFVVLGDVKDLESKLGNLKKGFDTLGKNAGLALAGLTASAYGFIEAAKVQEAAVNQLNQALKNQGNFTEAASKDLQSYASALQEVSLFGDEQIIQAEAILSTLGLSNEMTKQLTKSTLDLAQAKGMDLASAAELVTRSIGTEANNIRGTTVALEGFTGSTEKAKSAIEGLSRAYGGQAQAATQGLGATVQLKNAMSDLAENIGLALAPTVISITKHIKGLVDFLKENPEFAKLSAQAIVLGIQLTAAGVAISVVGKASIATSLAVAALNTQITFLGSVGLLGLNTGFGVLVRNVGLAYPLVIATGAAFAGWNIGKWVSDVTGLSDAIRRLGASLGELDAQRRLGADYISEQDFLLKKEQEGWVARAEARAADLQNEMDVEVQRTSLHQQKMDAYTAEQATYQQMSLQELLSLQNNLSQEVLLEKDASERKKKILEDELKARKAIDESQKNVQLAALSFASQMVTAFAGESKAAFYILKAIRIAEILINTFAADMMIQAVWAWNPPVAARLIGQNHVLSALSIAGVIGTAIAGYAVGTPSVRGDQLAQIHDREMIVPASFSDAIRSGELSLSGGASAPGTSGGEGGIYIDLTGSTFNGVTDKLVEDIFTKAGENMRNRTLSTLPA